MMTLELFDVLGRNIQLVGETMDAGPQSVRFDAVHLPGGIYTSCLTANNARREMKIIVGK